MRFSDEYKYLKELCNFDITLEPYISKYEFMKEDLCLHTSHETYSPRLFFNDEHDILVSSVHYEELEPRCIISFDIKEILEETLIFEDSFFIKIYEDDILIEEINA